MTSSLREELRHRPPFSGPEVSVFLNLLRATDRLSAAESRLLKGFGLSHPQYNVLRLLREAGPEGLACGEIASRMITRVPDVTRLVDRLEKSGLAERARRDSDRRVVCCKIMPAGIELLERVDPPLEQRIRELLGGLAEPRLIQLRDLLRELRKGLEQGEQR